MNSPHKGPVTRKMFSFDDVIMVNSCHLRFPSYELIARPSGHEVEMRVWAQLRLVFASFTTFIAPLYTWFLLTKLNTSYRWNSHSIETTSYEWKCPDHFEFFGVQTAPDTPLLIPELYSCIKTHFCGFKSSRDLKIRHINIWKMYFTPTGHK